MKKVSFYGVGVPIEGLPYRRRGALKKFKIVVNRSYKIEILVVKVFLLLSFYKKTIRLTSNKLLCNEAEIL